MENKKEDFQRGIYKLATLLLVAFISLSAFAQKQTITGRIIDINNEAIIGASILEKGTTNGTITDFDGKFSLEVSSKSTLIISYIGYKTQEIKASPNMEVTLSEDNEVLEEVVVIGYGTVKKRDVTQLFQVFQLKTYNNAH